MIWLGLLHGPFFSPYFRSGVAAAWETFAGSALEVNAVKSRLVVAGAKDFASLSSVYSSYDTANLIS